MKTRTLEGICIVGLVDLVYRIFLRQHVRAHLGMETRA
jgi:hypothetical protein